MKRRHFLQFASSSLAAIGLSQSDFVAKADRYGKALAQSTPRKLAMLVGINQYPVYRPLKGCLTDVDLQRELLINRFGFSPSDIIEISDTANLKPNRENILQVFQKHLIDQAKPGDVVVFHYSGHGAEVFDPDPVYDNSVLNGTIVPNDTHPSFGPVPDIMGRTLFLLMNAIKTDNVTAILDSCHSGGGLRGGATVRAVREQGGDARQAMPEEFELQQKLLAEVGLSAEEFQRKRQAGVARGIGIGSAQFSELALDMAYGDFHAGAFTYLLTRYLWQVPGSTSFDAVRNDLVRSTQITAATRNSSSQIPTFQAAPNSNSLAQPIYFTRSTRGSAEAAIKSISSNKVKFWLGGVSSQALAVADAQAGFTVLNDSREPIGEIQQTGRTGLLATGTIVSGKGIEPGMLMRETVVGLPANPQLVMGVDRSLGHDADAALRALNAALVSEQTGRSQLVATRVDEQTAFDCLLGRITPENSEQLAASGLTKLPPVGSISLFTQALEPLPATSGLSDESVATAINRLKPKFKVLLANKVLKALSATHSNLSISGEIFAAADEGRAISIQGTTGSRVAPFRSGESLKIRVANEDRRQALYLSCLAINSEGDISVIYPTNWGAPEDAALIQPRSEIVLPQAEDQEEYSIVVDDNDEVGYLEVMTIVSTGSLRNALRGLKEVANSRRVTRGSLPLEEGQELLLLSDLLGDINMLSRGEGSRAASRISADQTAVDSGAIAVFSTVVEVVK